MKDLSVCVIYTLSICFMFILLELFVVTNHYEKIIKIKDDEIKQLQFDYAKEHSYQEENYNAYERCMLELEMLK